MEDEQIEKIMEEMDTENELTSKDMTQKEKIEPVTKALSSMGSLWKKITTKLSDDQICFMCKKQLDKKEEFDIIKVPDHKVDKGLVAFVSVCKQCNSQKTDEVKKENE